MTPLRSLNKTDLFREKISRTPLAHYYPEVLPSRVQAMLRN